MMELREIACWVCMMLFIIVSVIILLDIKRDKIGREILKEAYQKELKEYESKKTWTQSKVDRYIKYDDYGNFRSVPSIYAVPSAGKTKCTIRMKDEKEIDITFACKVPIKEMMVKLEEDVDMFIIGDFCIARERIKEIAIHL